MPGRRFFYVSAALFLFHKPRFFKTSECCVHRLFVNTAFLGDQPPRRKADAVFIAVFYKAAVDGVISRL